MLYFYIWLFGVILSIISIMILFISNIFANDYIPIVSFIGVIIGIIIQAIGIIGEIIYN